MQIGKKEISNIFISIIFTLLINFLIYNLRVLLHYTTGIKILPFTQHPIARYICYFFFTLFFYKHCKSLKPFWVIFIPVLIIDSTTLIFGQSEIPLRFPFDTFYPLLGILSGLYLFKSKKAFSIAVATSVVFIFLAQLFIRPAIVWQMKEWRKLSFTNIPTETDYFLTVDSTHVKLNDTLKSKVRLLEFYFVGCVPCEQKYKPLMELRSMYSSDELQIILICDGSITNYASFINHWEKNKTSGITFLYDDKNSIKKYGIESFPTEFLFEGFSLVKADVGFGNMIKERWLNKENKTIKQILANDK